MFYTSIVLPVYRSIQRTAKHNGIWLYDTKEQKIYGIYNLNIFFNFYTYEYYIYQFTNI